MPIYEVVYARFSYLVVEAKDEDTARFIADDQDIEGYSECGWYHQETAEIIPDKPEEVIRVQAETNCLP